jgi:nitrogen fixation/metabolism regulation signal transduction histidine kinase
MLECLERNVMVEGLPEVLRRQLTAEVALDERINRLADNLHEHGAAERFDVLEHLCALARETHKYRVEIESNGLREATVMVNPEEMKDAIGNILRNAEVHGFIDPSRTDYILRIDIRFSSDGGSYVIDFFDNGAPLPEGMNKSRFGLYGEKAGATAGTGLGGYRIADVARRIGGDYDLFNTESGVVVRLILPVC